MITDAILQFFHTLISGIFALLPAWNVTANPQQAIAFRDWLVYYDGWVPIAEMITLVEFSGVVFVAVVAFKFIIKVVDWIRG